MNPVEKHSYHAYNMTSQTFLLSTACGKRLLFIPRSRGEFEINSPAHFLDPKMLFFWKFSQARIDKNMRFVVFGGCAIKNEIMHFADV